MGPEDVEGLFSSFTFATLIGGSELSTLATFAGGGPVSLLLAPCPSLLSGLSVVDAAVALSLTAEINDEILETANEMEGSSSVSLSKSMSFV